MVDWLKMSISVEAIKIAILITVDQPKSSVNISIENMINPL